MQIYYLVSINTGQLGKWKIIKIVGKFKKT